MQHRLIGLSQKHINFIAYSDFGSGKNNHSDIVKMKKILHKAIADELTEKQKYCVFQYYVEGRNMKDIAEELNVNPSTVTRHIQRAMRRIKRVARYY